MLGVGVNSLLSCSQEITKNYEISTEDDITRNRDGDLPKKRFYERSRIPVEDDLTRAGASAGDVYNVSEEDEREEKEILAQVVVGQIQGLAKRRGN